MTIRDRVREWLHSYLGVLSLEKAEQRRHMVAEQAMRNRHEDLALTLGLINERLGRLESHFTTEHVSRRPQAEVYDWEQIQAQQLAAMLKNPMGDD